MKRFFTTYWKYPNASRNTQPPFAPLQQSGSSAYNKRGVAAGDSVYVVSTLAIDGKRQPYLFGRILVEEVISREEAVKRSGSESLWAVDEWIWGPGGTPYNPYRRLDPELWPRMQFGVTDDASKGLFKDSPTSVNEQTLRGVRELRPSAGEFLDQVIDVTDKLPKVNKDFAVTKQMLSGQVYPPPSQQPSVQETYREGDPQPELGNRYERDQQARADCIAHYKAHCSICNFDFGEHYGAHMQGFIHVHHMTPVSQLGLGYKTDPVKDLRPVCANCHAVIHSRRDKPFTPAEAYRMLKIT